MNDFVGNFSWVEKEKVHFVTIFLFLSFIYLFFSQTFHGQLFTGQLDIAVILDATWSETLSQSIERNERLKDKLFQWWKDKDSS